MDDMIESDGALMKMEESPTITMKLTRKKAKLEAELAKINEALEVIKKYPDIQRVLDTISSIGRLI
jgi:uncharacterized alpha/beta hydrolase family protein